MNPTTTSRPGTSIALHLLDILLWFDRSRFAIILRAVVLKN